MSKVYTNITEDTPKYLVLDAGAIFVNYDIDEDTYESAMKTKSIGATSGANVFEIVPDIRYIEANGAKGKWKGGTHITSWDVSLTVNLLEFRLDTYKHALAAAKSTKTTINEIEYDEITAKNYIGVNDYIDNITFIGTHSGSDEPVIIQIFNALNVNGLTVNNTDSEDIAVELKFEGHYSLEDLSTPPFMILFPPMRV